MNAAPLALSKYADRIQGAAPGDCLAANCWLAAKPRSASQISPGCGLIKAVQYFLFDRSRTYQVERIMIGSVDDFTYERTNLRGDFRFPLTQLCIQLLDNRIHDRTSLR